jgi:hypothetical protein
MIMNEITTTDLSHFGYRELHLAKDLLQALEDQGLPEDFNDDGLTIMMNTNSGNVFFTNEDFQVAMVNGDKLKSFYSCPNCGNEGFADEILTKSGKCKECKEKVK